MRAEIRTARKAHYCGACDTPGAIKPGDRHRVWTLFPSDDLDLGQDRPIRGRECPSCSARYGRALTTATDRDTADDDYDRMGEA